MQEILIEETPRGAQRINRINYEICVLQALRDRLRCKEIWVEGADRFRHPDEDLPSDFSARRNDYYAALKQPMDAARFIGGLQQTMAQALSRLDVSLPYNPKVRLRAYGKNRLVVTPLEAQAEPVQLQRLKAEMERRWSMTSLLDVLKETDFRVGFTGAFKSLGTREVLSREDLQYRLLLCLYGLGTNMGLKRMVPGRGGLTYRELLYTRHRFIEKDALREAIRRVVNATLASRLSHVWGEGTTACAADSKKFGAWDQNLMTEWHISMICSGSRRAGSPNTGIPSRPSLREGTGRTTTGSSNWRAGMPWQAPMLARAFLRRHRADTTKALPVARGPGDLRKPHHRPTHCPGSVGPIILSQSVDPHFRSTAIPQLPELFQ